MSKLIDIARIILVSGESQKAAADRLGISEFALSRMISGRAGYDRIRDDQHKAFVADFPILDALVAEELQQEAVISFNGLGAQTLIPIVEAALKQSLTEEEKWSAHRLLARAYVEVAQDGLSDGLSVERNDIVSAHGHYDELTKLNLNFSPQRREIVALGIRLNKLGLDMVLQGGGKELIEDKPPLTGYIDLMKDLKRAYVAASARAKLPDSGDKVVSIGSSVEERVLRQMLLYCAHGICELSLEIGNSGKIAEVMKDLNIDSKIFRRDKRTLIGLVFLDMAWKRNKPKYCELFGLSELVLAEAS